MTSREADKIIKILSGKGYTTALRLVCGEKIGSGLHRDVYILKQNPDYVVKIVKDPSKAAFANASEWNHYVTNSEWKSFEKWLAPCIFINETGTILVQQRVTFKSKDLYPKKLPSLFTDTKIENFGWIGKRFVCCDYAYIPLATGLKLRRVKWWSLKDK